MATKYKVATGLLIAGIVCFVLFYLIGGDVDENGYVNEPFYLLPIGFIFKQVQRKYKQMIAIAKKK